MSDLTPERIEEALEAASTYVRFAPVGLTGDALHLVVLAAALREAQEREKQIADTVWRQHYEHAMHFHEIAMSDPFGAERLYDGLGRSVLDITGPPEYVQVLSPPADEANH